MQHRELKCDLFESSPSKVKVTLHQYYSALDVRAVLLVLFKSSSSVTFSFPNELFPDVHKRSFLFSNFGFNTGFIALTSAIH